MCSQGFEFGNTSRACIHNALRDVLEPNMWMKAGEHVFNIHAVVGVYVMIDERSHLSGIHFKTSGFAA